MEDPEELTDAVIWSDETTVKKAPKGKNIQLRVHASIPAEELPFNHQFQQGGFSVMFWGCISLWGIGPLVALEGNQNAYTYVDTLKRYFLPEIKAAERLYGFKFTFMQDNAPCHKAKTVTEFLERNGISCLDWPAGSPDLNPIENIWNILKVRRAKKFGFPLNRDELIQQVFTIWNELTIEDCEKCICNMERRLLEVVKMKGRCTKY